MYVSLLQILAAHRVDCCVNYTDNSNQSLFVAQTESESGQNT